MLRREATLVNTPMSNINDETIKEFSTVEAANYLNVSRPFVIKEIEKGNLPHRMVGTHRRVPFEELAKYAARMDAKRNEALDKLAANARELGLEY